MSARYVVGDVRDVLATIPDGSIDLVLTSPPFLALRSYLPADHPDKHREIGSEPDPATFLDTLLALTAEWRRVLAPHGSICVELGDTYSGSGGAGGDYGAGGMREGQARFKQVGSREHRSEREGTGADGGGRVVPVTGGPGYPLAKSLCMIPELYRVALAYGRNPLTGESSPAGRWRCRNVVRWHRPNPPVGALGDKFRPATSDMVIACTSGKRYFDLDAVRNAGSPNTHARTAKGVASRPTTGKADDDERRGGNFSTLATLHDTAGAPPLDTWVIPTALYAGSHYATFPPALVERPVKSMVPLKVCRTCGEPSRRITERSEGYAAAREAIGDMTTHKTGKRLGVGLTGDSRSELVKAAGRDITCAENVTIGWTDCGHDDWRSGVVLDPFAGSGTTLMVATGHGRDAIGIDIDERNAELALERVGPLLLTVEHLADGDDLAAT